jgi:hypothetical protein
MPKKTARRKAGAEKKKNAPSLLKLISLFYYEYVLSFFHTRLAMTLADIGGYVMIVMMIVTASQLGLWLERSESTEKS